MNNERYQKNMHKLGKALRILEQCNFSNSKLKKPYSKFQQAYVHWLKARKASINHHTAKEVQQLYDTHKYSPEQIANILNMNANDVADMIGNHLAQSLAPAWPDCDNVYNRLSYDISNFYD